MNIIAVGFLFFCAFVLQYFLTFLQIKSFTTHYRKMRKNGRVAIGKQSGAINAGAIVLFSIDGEGEILEGSYMQGVTVLARFKNLKGFEGKQLGHLSKENLKELHLAKPLEKAVLDSSKNFNLIMNGKEVLSPPSPFQKVGNIFKRKEKIIKLKKI